MTTTNHVKNNPNSNLNNNLNSNPNQHATPSTSTINLPKNFNTLGEAVLTQAPSATLSTGQTTVPQQFLYYERNRANVEHIVSKISFDKEFPLFVHEENNCLFIQVGVIGFENYPKDEATKVRPKIVYGRRWYIEQYMPTSEVIQTAYLAIEKTREHELREFFHVMIDSDNNVNEISVEGSRKMHRTTPFNTHMDLPLMADNAELFFSHSQINQPRINQPQTEQHSEQPLSIKDTLAHQLSLLRFASLGFKLKQCEILGNLVVLAITLDTEGKENSNIAKAFPEQINTTHHFVLESLVLESLVLNNTTNHQNHSQLADKLIYELFESMMKKSKEHISQYFQYDGFARFSQSISPRQIAKFSTETRLIDNKSRTPTFNNEFRYMIAKVDGDKAPMYAKNLTLYQTQREAINLHAHLDGYLPYTVSGNDNKQGAINRTSQDNDSDDTQEQEHSSEIIAMAWCDKTSFDDIKQQTGLSEPEVILLMRSSLKPSSFRLWRKRASGRIAKHKKLDESKNRSSNHTNKVRKRGQSKRIRKPDYS